MSEDEVFEDEEAVEDEFAPDSAVNPGQNKRKETRIAREQRESELWWQNVLSTPLGRKELWKLLKAGGYGERAFACGPNGFPQPDATWFQAGAKDYAERLHDSWQIMDFEAVYLMHCENDHRFDKAKHKLGIKES